MGFGLLGEEVKLRKKILNMSEIIESGILKKTYFYKNSSKIFADIYKCGNRFCIYRNDKIVGKFFTLQDAEDDVKAKIAEENE